MRNPGNQPSYIACASARTAGMIAWLAMNRRDRSEQHEREKLPSPGRALKKGCRRGFGWSRGIRRLAGVV